MSVPAFPDEVTTAAAPTAPPPFPDEAPRGKPQGVRPPSASGALDEAVQPGDIRDIISAYDMIASIPGQLKGGAAIVDEYFDGIARGRTPADTAARAKAANEKVMAGPLGSPISKLLSWAGLGGATEGKGHIDSAMERASELFAKGDDWVAENSKGLISKDDSSNIRQIFMAAAGGRGLEAGIRSVVGDAKVKTLATSPEALQAKFDSANQGKEPAKAAEAAAAKTAEAESVATAPPVKTRLAATEGKKLRLDPITGALGEEPPPVGEAMPKATSLDTALEKVKAGQLFDLTAEERIAYKGWKDAPPQVDIVDEQGKPLRENAGESARENGPIRSGSSRGNQRGAVDFSFGDRRAAEMVDEENKQSREMLKNASDQEHRGAWQYLSEEAGSFFNNNKYLLQKVDKLQELQPVIKNQQLAHDAGLSFSRLEDAFKRFQSAINKPEEAPIAAQNVRFLLDEMDHRQILSDYVKAVQEARGKLNPRSPRERAMGRSIDEALANVVKLPKNQRGGVDPRLLARMAAVGLGAWAGVYFSDEHDWQHALAGGIGVGMLSKAHPIEFAKAVKTALSKDGPRYSIAEPSQAWETYRRSWGIDTNLLQDKLDKMLPDAKAREEVLHARELGPAEVAKLSPEQRAYEHELDAAFDARLWEGVSADVLKSAQQNYVTHMLDWSKNDKGLVAKFLDRNFGSGMTTHTPYAEARSYATVKDLEAAGFKVISKDPTYILGAYSNSLINAISNKLLIDELKTMKTSPAGAAGPQRPINLLLSADKAPHQYVSIRHPLLQGLKVHPDIEGQLKLLFDTSAPGPWMKAASGLSDITKRFQVSFSLFHAKSLSEAAIRAANNPFKAAATAASATLRPGTNAFLQEIKKGSASPLVMRSLKAGLMYSVKGAGSEDAGVGFYPAMKELQSFANSVIPGAGAPVKLFAAASKWMDKFMWEHLHPALKLYLFDEKSRQLMANSLKAEKAGKGKALTQEEADTMAATFANDVEGGLNYRKIAMEAKTRFGRQLAEAAFSPAGRRGLQIAEFAPDWNIAAGRVVTQAAQKGSGVKGVLSPRLESDLYRQLIAKSALYYFVGFNALNVAMSGHYIWNNKDWTKIDMDAKGERHLQIDKGMMEVPNMVRQPGQEFLNKMGAVPGEALDQLFGTEYLAPREDKRTGQISAGPPMKGNRAEHALGRLLPFAAHESPTTGPGETFATATGLAQITGSTPETRAKRKADERKRRARERAEAKP